MTGSERRPKLVRVEKIAAAADAIFPAGDVATFRYGMANSEMSLPVNYTVIGWMIGAPRVGDCVVLLRIVRNEVRCPGSFKSSTVRSIDGATFQTHNSVYRWCELCAEESDVLSTIDRN